MVVKIKENFERLDMLKIMMNPKNKFYVETDLWDIKIDIYQKDNLNFK